MRFLGKFILSIFANLIAILILTSFLPNFILKGDIVSLIEISVVFSLINLCLRPILKFLFSPLLILTFGLFSLVINASLIFLVDFLFKEVTIKGLDTLFISTIIIAVINLILNLGAKLANRK